MKMVLALAAVLLATIGGAAWADDDVEMLWENLITETGVYQTVYATALDEADNVYLGGMYDDPLSPDTWFTRYDAAGVAQYDYHDATFGPACGVKVDADGNLYGAANVEEFNAGLRIKIFKLSPTGQVIWSQTMTNTTGVNRTLECEDVALDSAGNFYIARQMNNGVDLGNQFMLVKYDADGVRQWWRNYGETGHDCAFAQWIELDPNEDPVLFGFTTDTAMQWDFLTVKYYADGTLAWHDLYKYSEETDDYPGGLAVDGEGNVYVGGDIEWGIVLVKYDADGVRQWAVTEEGLSPTEYDWVYAMAADPEGNVLVGERSVLTWPTGKVGYNSSGYVYKFDPDGNKLWEVYHQGAVIGNKFGEVDDLQVDAAGNVYAAYMVSGSILHNTIELIKYDPDGNQQWAIDYPNALLWVVDDVFVELNARGRIALTIALYDLNLDYTSVYARLFAQPEQCEIDGQFYAAGATNPANVCQVCAPTISATAWSDNDGASCNDGTFCNGADTCAGGECAVHPGDPCDPNTQTCNEETDTCDALGDDDDDSADDDAADDDATDDDATDDDATDDDDDSTVLPDDDDDDDGCGRG
ncbi:MAG TPA: SBBP repeat-containing protein [bacterium]|nr:SBBP repeat-containing protein [bacterium]